MFCPECGKKIENESIYCPYCGTKIPSPAQLPLRYGNATEEVRATSASEPEKVNLKTALRSSRQHPRKLLTQIVIAALALALATSTAYAAYYVYTNVYLPSQQTQQQDSKANEAPTYTIETKTVDVSVPSDPFISPGKRTSDTWSYPQIVSSAPSNVIDDINRCIQEQMEETAEQTNAAPDTWDELQNGAESGLEEYGLCTLTVEWLSPIWMTRTCAFVMQATPLSGAHTATTSPRVKPTTYKPATKLTHGPFSEWTKRRRYQQPSGP